jgi:hypothetical protein
MTNNNRPVPERARRLGKALIALARAELEAEAQAQTTEDTSASKEAKKTAPTTNPGDAA